MSERVLIMAGGTGGHVFPALAVARALRARGIAVDWLGSRGGMEERVVQADGIAFHGLRIRGLRGKGAAAWLLVPLRLMVAVGEALTVMIRLQPRVVLGMGGFAAGPGGVAAWLLHRSKMEKTDALDLGVSREILARLVGISRESLSRELSRLAANGLISVERRRVLLLDRAGLQKLADS